VTAVASVPKNLIVCEDNMSEPTFRLTSEQQGEVKLRWRKGQGISQIATKAKLVREYVQAYVKYLNSQEGIIR